MVRRLTLTMFALVILVWGCAKPGPPPGGPVDEDPPWIVSTDPVEGSVQVPAESGIFVLFSEEMDRSSVERSIVLEPRTPLRRAGWRGPRLEIRTAEALEESTTYVVSVGDGSRDYHGVAMENPTAFAFSTGSVIDDCTVAGLVTADGEPVAGATVWACAASPEPDSLGIVGNCGRGVTTAAGGAYSIGYLSPAHSPYSLVAFLDSDGDGSYSTTDETGTISLGAALFAAPGDTARGIDLELRVPVGVEILEGAGTPERPAPEPDNEPLEPRTDPPLQEPEEQQ